VLYLLVVSTFKRRNYSISYQTLG